jgi:hypothetical protein
MTIDEKYLKNKATEFFHDDKSQDEDEYIDNLMSLLHEVSKDTQKAIAIQLSNKAAEYKDKPEFVEHCKMLANAIAIVDKDYEIYK